MGGGQNVLRFVHHLEHSLQLLRLLRSHSKLLLSDFRGDSGEAGKVEREVPLELSKSGGRGQYSLHFERVILIEVNAIETTIRGADLILRSHGFPDQVLLHVYGVGGKRVL